MNPRNVLPPANTGRWVASRKAAVVTAVSSGMITIEDACRRYQMSEEEFCAWQRAFENNGIAGLCRKRRGIGSSPAMMTRRVGRGGACA
jgi:hypothetical protein